MALRDQQKGTQTTQVQMQVLIPPAHLPTAKRRWREIQNHTPNSGGCDSLKHPTALVPNKVFAVSVANLP